MAVMLVAIDSASIAMSLHALPDIFATADFHGLISTKDSIILYSLCWGVYSIGVVIGSIMLGKLSDTFGRIPTLKLALIGMVLGYTVLLIAILHHWFLVIIASRLLTGFFSITCPLTQTIAIDLSGHNEKTHHLNWITLGYSIGFLIGPALIQLLNVFQVELVNHHLILCAITMCCFNYITILNKQDVPKPIKTTTLNIVRHIQDIWPILAMLAINEIAYGLFCHMAPAILLNKGSFTLVSNSWFYSIIGISHIAGVLFLQENNQWLKHHRSFITHATLISSVVFLLPISTNINWIFVTTVAICFLQVGICNMLLSRASQLTAKENQGQAMGICSTVTFISYSLASPLPLLFTTYDPSIFIICSLCMLALSIYSQRSKYLSETYVTYEASTHKAIR